MAAAASRGNKKMHLTTIVADVHKSNGEMCIFFFFLSPLIKKNKMGDAPSRQDPPPFQLCVCVCDGSIFSKKGKIIILQFSHSQVWRRMRMGNMFCFWPLKEVGGGEVRKQLWWRIFVLFSCFHPLWEWVERNWNTRELRAIFLFFYLFSFSFRRTSRKGGGPQGSGIPFGRRSSSSFIFFILILYLPLGKRRRRRNKK